MYRIAEFERRKNKLIFTGFATNRYMLSAKGELFADGQKMNLTDKRKALYREINLFSGRKDVLGHKLYDKDIIYNKTAGQYGYIKFMPSKGAFLMILKNGNIEIPYSFLDCYEVSLKYVGNLYTTTPQTIIKKY